MKKIEWLLSEPNGFLVLLIVFLSIVALLGMGYPREVPMNQRIKFVEFVKTPTDVIGQVLIDTHTGDHYLSIAHVGTVRLRRER